MKKNILRVIFFSYFFIATSLILNIYAQDLPDIIEPDSVYLRAMALSTDEEDFIPLSPKASSIMKYGDYPVGLHTGLIDITIPIYTIERNWIKVPIEFKYHASGLKYDDMSNELGMGWTLIAGGLVTQSYRGAIDGTCKTYAKDVNSFKICNDNTPKENGYEYLREIEKGSRLNYKWGVGYYEYIGKADGEFDMYSFSFLHHSGNFCLPFHDTKIYGPINNNQTGVFIPANGMKVAQRALNFPKVGLMLLDDEGISYTFELKDPDQGKSYREYYLTEIISADKTDTINFIYDTFSLGSRNRMERPYINYTATYRIPQSIDTSIGLSSEVVESGGMSYIELRPPRLARIEFRGGHIDFEYAIRNNVETWDLQKIRIYNNLQSIPLQTITLTKSEPSNQYNFLNKVTFTNSQNESYDYQFGYKGRRNSGGIDYWGYYNGASVPYGKRFIPKFNNMPYGMEGTDRTANEWAMQGGVLNKIVYPTKGYSEFIYEAHKSRTGSAYYPETFGGLRIKEIRNYLYDGTLAERKWYKYGEGESGVGTAAAFPNINDFKTISLDLVTYLYKSMGNTVNYYLHYKNNNTTYSSFPKKNYFISGSPVVYTHVAEYVGNDTENYGVTVYKYEVFKDEEFDPYLHEDTYRLNSPNIPLRTYAWKTGKLKSKHIYKKEDGEPKLIYSLNNEYKDILQAEYRNLRVLPYVNFIYSPGDLFSYAPDHSKNFCIYPFYSMHFDNRAPYDYFNYYTTTGLRVLTSSKETTDGFTTYTYYDSYNEIGLPEKTRTVTSTGDNLSTIYKYTSDHSGMQSANILTQIMEKTTYKNDNIFLQKEITNYSLWHSRFYAPENKQIQYQDGTTQTIRKYQYDTKKNVLEIVRTDTDKTAYVWGYNYQYPIAEIKNVGYAEVKTYIPESTLKSVAENKEPSASDWSLIEKLKTSMPNALITTYKYKPLIGVTDIVDARGVTSSYEYDTFGRLKNSYLKENGVNKKLEKYEYFYTEKEYVPFFFSLKFGEGYEGIHYGKEWVNSYSKDKQGHFETSVQGGSGQFQYTWTLKDSSGNIVENRTEVTGKYSYYFTKTGNMTLTCKLLDLNTFEELSETRNFTVIDFTLPWPLVIGIVSKCPNVTTPGERIEFGIDTRGGSGNFTYKWTLTESNGSVLNTYTGSSTYIYTLHSYGNYSIACEVTDNITGEKLIDRHGHTVTWFVQFDNIKESLNYIESTMTFKEASTIYFYLDFTPGDTNATVEFELGNKKEVYSTKLPTKSVSMTFAPGTYKFSIKLSSTKSGYAEGQIYLSSSDKGTVGPNHQLRVVNQLK